MKVVLEVPETTLGIFVNYLFHDGEGIVMGTDTVNGDDLIEGFKKLKGERDADKQ